MTTLELVFLFCAVLGGTILAIQLVLAFTGLGGDDLDVGGDVDLPDVDDATGFDANAFDAQGAWLIGMFTFKTIIAAVTFFGLGGLAAYSAGMGATASTLIAAVAGCFAFYAVYWLFRSLKKLTHDGTIHIERAVGERGKVYIPIPPQGQGEGKIQIKVQNQLIELRAVTNEPHRLATGATVIVKRLTSPSSVEVASFETEVAGEHLAPSEVAS